MKLIASKIIGIAAAAALLIPSLASAANIDVLWYDTSANNGSLHDRVVSGAVKPVVHEHYTIHDPKTGLPVQTDEVGAGINLRELARYAHTFECRSGMDLSKCLPISTN